MALDPPDNISKLSQLSGPEEAQFRHMQRAAETVAMKRPDLDHSALKRYLTDYLDAYTKTKENVADTEHDMLAKGQVMSVQQRNSTSRSALNKFTHNFSTDTLQEYGADGREAWNLMQKEMRGPTFGERLIKNVYDSDRGGLQISGVIGGIIGFMIGRKRFEGAESTVVGRIMTVAATVLGAWVSNAIFGSLEAKRRNTPPAGFVPFPATDASERLSDNATPPADSNMEKAIAEAQSTPANSTPTPPSQGASVTNSASGTFAPPSLPPKPMAPPPTTHKPQNNANPTR